MSAIINARRAAERLLNNLTPTVVTYFEGVSVDESETPDGMYQHCQFIIQPPTDPVFPPGYHRENIQMQIFITDKKGGGVVDLYDRAELIRNAFYKGLSLTEGDTRIYVLRTAQITGAIPLQDRMLVTVLIPLTVEDYNYD